jgi:hypothetical protein
MQGARFCVGLVLQDFSQGGLGAFDPRGQHRFLAGEGAEQNGGVGDPLKEAVVAGQAGVGRAQQWDQLLPIELRRGESTKVVRNRSHQPIRSTGRLMAATACWMA